jgi:hypothetical protein
MQLVSFRGHWYCIRNIRVVLRFNLLCLISLLIEFFCLVLTGVLFVIRLIRYWCSRVIRAGPIIYKPDYIIDWESFYFRALIIIILLPGVESPMRVRPPQNFPSQVVFPNLFIPACRVRGDFFFISNLF